MQNFTKRFGSILLFLLIMLASMILTDRIFLLTGITDKPFFPLTFYPQNVNVTVHLHWKE